MSENATQESKTELPTEKRLSKIREEGQLFVSTDACQVASLVAGFVTLTFLSKEIIQDMKNVLIYTLSEIQSSKPLSFEDAKNLFFNSISIIGPNLLIVAAITASVGALAVMLQTGWNVKQKKLHFRFGMLNPISGIMRLFSVQGLIATGKAIVKLAIIIPVAYVALKDIVPMLPSLMQKSVTSQLFFIAETLEGVFWKIVLVLAVIAAVDFVWGKIRWLKQQMMTKDEVKDERKAMEGDEAMRKKIQAKGLQRILQRIRSAVPTADVVVTNPTHYAVAIKYDKFLGGAPRVVAKGKNFLAERIKAIARENNIPVLERKPLARALYASTEVGSEIPYELFRAVAEVLAYIYKIKGVKNSPSQQKVSRSAGAA